MNSYFPPLDQLSRSFQINPLTITLFSESGQKKAKSQNAVGYTVKHAVVSLNHFENFISVFIPPHPGDSWE